MNHRNLNVSEIVARILSNGGITIHRDNAVDFHEVHGPGIVVGLDHDSKVCDCEKDLANLVAEYCYNANLTSHFGFWLESNQPEHMGAWPAILHRDVCVVIPDHTAHQVAYACALAVQYDQLSVYHFGSAKCVDLMPAHEFRGLVNAPTAIWYDTMTIGPEKLIAIHADSHLSFPGTPLPSTSCTLWRGYRGEVEYIPLDDDKFTDWHRESTASQYFKHRASDRQSQTRRIACRKLVVSDCVSSGLHLTSCDRDGYCNYCGEQE